MSDDVNALIRAANDGDAQALRHLFARVYAQLKRLAHVQLARAGGQTLNTTGLVHEAYLKLAQPGERDLRDREHFFPLAVRAMRQIVVVCGAEIRFSKYMTSIDHERLETLFDAAMDLAAAERDAYLARECGHDTALRAELDRWLALDATLGEFLESPPDLLAQARAAGVRDALDPPQRFGPWRVLHSLGVGGMGEVWLAERARLSRPTAGASRWPIARVAVSR